MLYTPPRNLVLVTAPTEEPITLPEAKAFLRVESGDTEQDGVIAAFISGARRYVEHQTNRKLITQTWKLLLDEFPCRTGRDPYASIDLPHPPLQSVTSIEYMDVEGNPQTLATSVYLVDTGTLPGRVRLKRNQEWPATPSYEPNAVAVTFRAGYGGPESVEDDLRQAMWLILGDSYENREAQIAGTIMTGNDRLGELIDPHRYVEAA